MTIKWLVAGVVAWLLLRVPTATDDDDDDSQAESESKKEDEKSASAQPGAKPNPQLSQHFAWKEFYRPLDQNPPQETLEGYVRMAKILETVRTWFDDRPIIITPHGGWQPSNPATAGWPDRGHNSRHRTSIDRDAEFRQGVAVDFAVKGLSVKEVWEGMRTMQEHGAIPKGGLKAYPKEGFVHYDTRPAPHWQPEYVAV